jgi:hypothetical protein
VEKLLLTRQETNPDCDKLFNVDASSWKGSTQAALVAVEHTTQFNPSAIEINAK